ncbi:IS110 family transposase [Candidatus Galacturonibacter soehngenii]|uniref:IS110 family transposase n=1 Tax=Candidatus Galacturonatibacter soehngenii TaxID=2307010 RepID=A0A7V7QID3_9FIRM|nr:IS110 family transposase [Candidatus Galacturonibacter soehngenii]KAB1435909.1 IS110 family transposase [Candidatus Galacturonibacter soehngenii]KAB1435913.1 IS110 family transposase [Candidatus Galacturonibacter soehngenii]KAB1439870.1 IS110 family transposase [Candidatus Galacturonibacter soehngenii]
MNCKQNQKINQVKESTLVVGIDIGSTTQYARAFDWRGIELGKVFKFSNSREGFESFKNWMRWIQDKNKKSDVIVGIEPTGHYWFDLGAYLEDESLLLVMVNPYAVKQTKELDDNSQSKNDNKDPKVIAKLVIEGRYSAPYTPDGVYADLRIMASNRKRLIRELTQIKNRFARWFAIYFPEYSDVFGDYESQSSMLLLKTVCTPEAIVELGAEKINQIWRDAKLRAVGMKRATTLCETAKRSIGLKKGSSAAEYEMKLLLQDYDYKKAQLESVMDEIESLCKKIPESEQMLAIKGIGIITVAGFLAEVGDARRFESPRQIQKLAGLSLRENSSGKHKGQTTISKRGRSKLRAVLFNAAIPLIATNPEFRALHEYYTTRANNPLKKKQSVIAISCKLIRIFYAILTKGVSYDAQKMMSDIHRQSVAA